MTMIFWSGLQWNPSSITFNIDQNWKFEKKLFIFTKWRFDTHENIQANASGFDNNSEIWKIV